MPLHDIGGQLVDGAVRDNPAGIEDGEFLRDAAHEIEVLLDQQDGAVPLPGIRLMI
jgi:hypothetical protein